MKKHILNYPHKDERYYRPNEVNLLQDDAGKAEKILGWKPKTKFTALVNLMMDFELANINKNN
ncbi:MAG: GDP-mannose 4,6-dehydratase [Candidatus Azambacteria bacterium]|nr:GDP-mannose 4,6-dehydratase [Candidatus Azambacteria bacterium]